MKLLLAGENVVTPAESVLWDPWEDVCQPRPNEGLKAIGDISFTPDNAASTSL
jgi:hypothetical protein